MDGWCKAANRERGQESRRLEQYRVSVQRMDVICVLTGCRVRVTSLFIKTSVVWPVDEKAMMMHRKCAVSHVTP
jgi:hypothetical protein